MRAGEEEGTMTTVYLSKNMTVLLYYAAKNNTHFVKQGRFNQQQAA